MYVGIELKESGLCGFFMIVHNTETEQCINISVTLA